MNRILFTFIGLLFCAGSANAQQFVAVKVEAEDFISKHSDWRLTTNGNTPNVRPDPDGSHAGSASGRAYMELLPDTRVTHSDQLVSGRNFWNAAGTGPELSYNVNIPESGRYLVYVKAYSTGTEDNGIHVGLNGRNPASGERMQWCSGKNQWTWGSAQRTNSNHCGVERTIFLDFAFAGSNTVTFSAREDGFEFDQFILLKTSNNSCAPNSNDQIACNNGTTNIPAQTETPVAAPPQPEPEPVVEPEPAPEPQPIKLVLLLRRQVHRQTRLQPHRHQLQHRRPQHQAASQFARALPAIQTVMALVGKTIKVAWYPGLPVLHLP